MTAYLFDRRLRGPPSLRFRLALSRFRLEVRRILRMPILRMPVLRVPIEENGFGGIPGRHPAGVGRAGRGRGDDADKSVKNGIGEEGGCGDEELHGRETAAWSAHKKET